MAGELDLHSAQALTDAVDERLRDGVLDIDVDLSELSFCDVSGLNAFLRARLSAIACGGSLRLHHPTPMLTRLFLLTGTHGVLLAAGAGLPGGRVTVHGSGDFGRTRPHHGGRRRPALFADDGGLR
ncbi:STAS domain-containing protein [Streptomyces sp. G-G2]|uniref:STAS domain-containing protein n=1 Tax=Streptomyces sp. G-G2 TaxID=3046201 RepID=UPI0024BBB546|nr:STAS domain-containing protein [Streptomyces sp. G-G2]MDJ0383549.1 STAS domain-containing protein [Streptomyces sp. G-G2]